MVDIDTGWGGAFNIAKTIRDMERAGAAAVHLEDQVAQKRCGHRPGKELVSQEEMVDRVTAAVDARKDPSFFIMARTDAFAREGLEAAIERAQAYVAAGADGIFAEAIKVEADYRAFREALDVPILANMTEFGQTELWNKQQLGEWGASMILYPLSAFRAMNKAWSRGINARWWIKCKPVWSFTIIWVTTSTSKNWIVYFLKIKINRKNDYRNFAHKTHWVLGCGKRGEYYDR